MKVLTTAGLTKLIQLIKSSFISNTDTVTTNTVTLANVATTGDFDDLINKPTIGNGTITFTQGGVVKGTMTANQTGNSTIALDAGGGGGTPTNMVTTDTTQTISAEKEFSNRIVFGNKISFDSSSSNYQYIAKEGGNGYENITIRGNTGTTDAVIKVGYEGTGTYYTLGGYFFDVEDGGNGMWLGSANSRSCLTKGNVNGDTVFIFPNPLQNNANERLAIGLNDVLTYRKANGTVVDLLNPTANLDNTKFDGQWVNSNLRIANQVTAPTADVDYDLSNYLPNDGHDYEVAFNVSGFTTSTSSANIVIRLGSPIFGDINVGRARVPNNSTVSMPAEGTGILPIPASDKRVILRGISNNIGNVTIDALGYRRIGTNI